MIAVAAQIPCRFCLIADTAFAKLQGATELAPHSNKFTIDLMGLEISDDHLARIGTPLPFNVRDADGTLLLARGRLVDTPEQLVGRKFVFVANLAPESERADSILRSMYLPVHLFMAVFGYGALFAAFPEAYATVFSGFYLAFMLAVGLVFRRMSKDTSDYFRAGGAMPWWLTGASAWVLISEKTNPG